MKKAILFLLVMSLLLSMAACGAKEEPAPETTQLPDLSTTAPTESATEPTLAPTEPEWEPGTIRAENIGVLWTTYQRGDKVRVIGKFGSYYVVQAEDVDHLVDSRFLRLAGEEIPEESTGYARYKTLVYPNAYLIGDKPIQLSFNKKVQILDSKADWLFIKWEDGSGYVLASQISPYYIQSGGSSDDGSGGGGSSGSSGGSGGGSSGGQDGSDVNLGTLSSFGGDYQVKLLGAYSGPKFESMEPTEGIILSDDTEGYMMLLRRGDEVKITVKTDTSCTLYFDGFEGTVPRWAVSFPNDETYTPWDAYARWNTVVYSDYQCTAELTKFSTNQRVEVVDELMEMDLYIVRVDGQIGYTSMDMLSKYPSQSQGSGDSGDGGSSGGSGNDGGGGSGPEWTPPVL